MLDQTVAEIRRMNANDVYAQRMQIKINNGMLAAVARQACGYHPFMDEAERAAAIKAATAIVKLVKQEKTAGIDSDIVALIEATNASRAAFDVMNATAEKEMKKAARKLPGYAFAKGVRGFGEVSFSRIVANAGPLHRYRCYKTLQHRLGLGLYNGHAGSTWKRDGLRSKAGLKPLTTDEWIDFGYSPKRNSVMFNIRESLFRAQWTSAAKTGADSGEPSGPYGRIYAERRARTAVTHQDWSAKHSHDDALRIMVKALVRDTWRAWCDDMRANHGWAQPSRTVGAGVAGQHANAPAE